METLEDALKDQLPILDQILAAREIDPTLRPLAAAMLFVEECVVSIEGDTKDDYLEKPWFPDIYRTVYRWYLARYGARLSTSSRAILTGMVSLFGALFKVEVPLVAEAPAEEPRRKWITFPDAVLPEEEPLQWMTEPPNLSNLLETERVQLREEVLTVGNCVRGLVRDFSTAELLDPEHKRLARTIQAHLSVGCEYVLDARDMGHAAIWEWHMAVEKSLKVFLLQKECEFPPTHDCVMLAEIAGKGGLRVDPASLAKMPSGGEAVRHRYGEGATLGQLELAKLYGAALRLCGECGRQLERNMRIRGTRFLIGPMRFLDSKSTKKARSSSPEPGQ